jgi:hypothetical protein
MGEEAAHPPTVRYGPKVLETIVGWDKQSGYLTGLGITRHRVLVFVLASLHAFPVRCKAPALRTWA